MEKETEIEIEKLHQNHPNCQTNNSFDISKFWGTSEEDFALRPQDYVKSSFANWGNKTENKNVFCDNPTQIEINNQIADFARDENNLHLISNMGFAYQYGLSKVLTSASNANDLGQFSLAKEELERAKLVVSQADTFPFRAWIGFSERAGDWFTHPIKNTGEFLKGFYQIAKFGVNIALDMIINKKDFQDFILYKTTQEDDVNELMNKYEQIIAGQDPEIQDAEAIKKIKQEYEELKQIKEDNAKKWENCLISKDVNSAAELSKQIINLPIEKKQEAVGALICDILIGHKIAKLLNYTANSAWNSAKNLKTIKNLRNKFNLISGSQEGCIVTLDPGIMRPDAELEVLYNYYPNKNPIDIKKGATENGIITAGGVKEIRTALILEENGCISSFERPMSPAEAIHEGLEFLAEENTLTEIVDKANNLIISDNPPSISEIRASIEADIQKTATLLSNKGIADQPVESIIKKLSGQIKSDLREGILDKKNLAYKITEKLKGDRVIKLAQEGVKKSITGAGDITKKGSAGADFMCIDKNGDKFPADIKGFNPKFDTNESFIKKMNKGLDTGEHLVLNLEASDPESCSSLLKEFLDNHPEKIDKVKLVVNKGSHNVLNKTKWFYKYKNVAVSNVPFVDIRNLLNANSLPESSFLNPFIYGNPFSKKSKLLNDGQSFLVPPTFNMMPGNGLNIKADSDDASTKSFLQRFFENTGQYSELSFKEKEKIREMINKNAERAIKSREEHGTKWEVGIEPGNQGLEKLINMRYRYVQAMEQAAKQYIQDLEYRADVNQKVKLGWLKSHRLLNFY